MEEEHWTTTEVDELIEINNVKPCLRDTKSEAYRTINEITTKLGTHAADLKIEEN